MTSHTFTASELQQIVTSFLGQYNHVLPTFSNASPGEMQRASRRLTDEVFSETFNEQRTGLPLEASVVAPKLNPRFKQDLRSKSPKTTRDAILLQFRDNFVPSWTVEARRLVEERNDHLLTPWDYLQAEQTVLSIPAVRTKLPITIEGQNFDLDRELVAGLLYFERNGSPRVSYQDIQFHRFPPASQTLDNFRLNNPERNEISLSGSIIRFIPFYLLLLKTDNGPYQKIIFTEVSFLQGLLTSARWNQVSIQDYALRYITAERVDEVKIN